MGGTLVKDVRYVDAFRYEFFVVVVVVACASFYFDRSGITSLGKIL